MKINGMQNQQFMPKYANKTIIKKNYSAEKNCTPKSFNPCYYQAINNIHFGSSSKKENFVYMSHGGKVTLFVDLPMSNNESQIPITINEDTVKKYLSDKNGNILIENLKMLNNLFGQIMADKQNDANETFSKYSKIFDSLKEYREEYDAIMDKVQDNEYINMDALEDLNDLIEEKKEKDREDFLKALKEGDSQKIEELAIRITMPIDKKELSSYIGEIGAEYSFDKIKKDTMDVVKTVFLLSKTKEGYDFSNINKKQELADELLFIKNECSKKEYRRILAFLEQKAEEKGIDLNLAEQFLYVISSQKFYPSPLDEIYSTLEKYKCGAEEADFLTYCMEMFSIKEPEFEEFFTNGLNQKTKKCDRDIIERFKEIYEGAAKLMDEIYMETTDDDGDCWKRLCYLEPVKITINYFNMYKDAKTGKLLPDAPNAEDYIKTVKSYYEP